MLHMHKYVYITRNDNSALCIYGITSEMRCRDDTVAKVVDARSHCKSMQQSSVTPTKQAVGGGGGGGVGVVGDCCMLSTIPCSGFLYLQFLAECHPYILFRFLHLFHSFFINVSIPTM